MPVPTAAASTAVALPAWSMPLWSVPPAAQPLTRLGAVPPPPPGATVVTTGAKWLVPRGGSSPVTGGDAALSAAGESLACPQAAAKREGNFDGGRTLDLSSSAGTAFDLQLDFSSSDSDSELWSMAVRPLPCIPSHQPATLISVDVRLFRSWQSCTSPGSAAFPAS